MKKRNETQRNFSNLVFVFLIDSWFYYNDFTKDILNKLSQPEESTNTVPNSFFFHSTFIIFAHLTQTRKKKKKKEKFLNLILILICPNSYTLYLTTVGLLFISSFILPWTWFVPFRLAVIEKIRSVRNYPMCLF